MSDLFLMAVKTLSPLLLLLLAWLSVQLERWIRAKIKNAYLESVLVRLDEAVLTVVKDVQQTVVDAIKEASADGKLDAAEKERIKQSAIHAIKAYLGAKGLGELGKILGLDSLTVDKLLGSRVEATVHDLRRSSVAIAEGISSPLLE